MVPMKTISTGKKQGRALRVTHDRERSYVSFGRPEWSTSSAPSGYDRNGYTTSSRASEPANSNRSWLVTAGTGR